MEEWLGKRVRSHYLPEILPLRERNYLYFVQSWHEGASLQQRLDAGHHFSCAEVAGLGIRLMKALGALHRLDVVHRDVKPGNLHLDGAGKLRLLDLGVAWCPACPASEAGEVPGTPSFLAPELFGQGRAGPSTDLYAAGVTLYHLLTRKYPYGEVEPFQHPRFGEPAPPSRYRPDIPAWLENVLLKAGTALRDRRGIPCRPGTGRGHPPFPPPADAGHGAGSVALLAGGGLRFPGVQPASCLPAAGGLAS
jgi:protein phosphatase